MSDEPPSQREDFEIAIVCALPLEFSAVSLVFDQFWDKQGDRYGKAVGDTNSYRTGRIGKYNVVLALLPHMGKSNAAVAITSLRSSYTRLRLALLVGICGGVPRTGSGDEILLGDVIISRTVVQYDFGRQYPDRFVRKETLDDNLAKPNKDIRSLLALLEDTFVKEDLEERTAFFLDKLQETDSQSAVRDASRRKRQAKYGYPGAAEDKLFQPSYRHKHHILPTCICKQCHERSDPVCDEALDASCDDLGCDGRFLVLREGLAEKRGLEQDNDKAAQAPAIFIGRVASGDMVMKSGEDRDRIAEKEGVIAFEMEGAGIWEEVPCLVVKGVCDYSDCHKNEKWQNFAAATAASATKAILERYVQTDKTRERLVGEASPQRHWIVPFGRNKDFVGRESILAQLLERIPPGVDEDDCQRTAIEGLGGVGKTQIALEAAFRVRDEHQDHSVFWVPAVDATSFENAYREIGRQLKVEGIDEDKADVRSLVKTALGHERAGSWLLIVDNADDIELLFGNTETMALCDYLPFSRKGSILFTTRNHEAVVRLDIPERNVIIAAEMSRAEAVELLQRSLKGNQTRDTKSTTSLLDLLANLPLAIKQASAYMAKTGMSTTKYLDYCRLSDKNLIRLLSKAFEDRGRYKSIRNPVATTWLISFNHISRGNQLAANYLRFMCFLAEKEIPLSLLPPVDDELEVAEAIGTLKAYAFITEREESSSFDIHRLVRLAMQNWLDEEGEREMCITEVIQRLAEAFPFPRYENRDVWTKYLPHAQTALEFREDSTDEEAERRLLFNVANSHSILGKYQEAEQMHRQTLELKEKVLGKEHPDTLDTMNNLALVLDNRGKYEEAEHMHRLALEGSMKVLGKEHPDTLSSMNNLAIVLNSQGKYEEAEQMHRQTLELKEKVLGREHSKTLDSINNLALVLRRQGKYKEAEQMHRQTLELMEKLLGKEHPRTLDTMNNLANVLNGQGKYEEAEQMHRQTLELKEKVLGKEHPVTLNSMNNLANVLDDQGKYGEAEQMHRQTLELMEKVLGKERPVTLNSMNNLANVLDNQGKYEEAEQMHRRTLEPRERMLGKEHPDTLDSMNNLANVLDNQGKYGEAEQMHRQALELMEEILGKEHPNTLDSMNSLALVLRHQGKYEEAEQIHRQTLEPREKMLGKEHPDTLDSMNNLASVLQNQRKYEEAEQMHRQTLKLRDKVLGKEHPRTLNSMDNLALVLRRQGKYEEAEQMHLLALEGYMKVLGKEHPDTLNSMYNLANVLDNQGRYEEAEQMHWRTLELKEKVLGKEHPRTLDSMDNLALVLDSQGKYEEAERIRSRLKG
jgi:tetratricopeptide (TPR) repeat protein/nucleoside phosphorylase